MKKWHCRQRHKQVCTVEYYHSRFLTHQDYVFLKWSGCVRKYSKEGISEIERSFYLENINLTV